MKNVLKIFWIAAFLSLTLPGCGDKNVPELPAPDYKPLQEQTDPEDPETPGGDDPDTPPGTNPWDENRGKVVTPSGEGWTSKTIREGITYYTFSGKEAICGNQMEEVFVIDLDLSNPNYEVKLTYTNPTVVTSSVHTTYNSIATMNAGYEAGSIFIRSDGKTRSGLPNNQIGTTGVNNWKSEAAVYCDGQRNIKISFEGGYYPRPYVDPALNGGPGISQVVNAQRKAYNDLVSTWPYILSSAPMLIDDYKPVGENFCDYTITDSQVNKLNSEDPQRHQRVRHPRTAVALTENNHFIMFTVDGRQTSKGMSCRELTRFLVKYFNPQYALNLDGGGSTTLCVEGEGDPTTHVVNYPCDNNKYDHAGERVRDTHFVIVAK